MRISLVSVTPNLVTVGTMVTVVVTVSEDQGFMTSEKLLLTTNDELTFIVQDS